jgi:hypothetical protein
VIPHVDLTITPQVYRDFLQAYPNVINRGVVDISKSRISANLVRRNDSYTGPVIVKTDRNYGGSLEQQLFARSLRGRWARVERRLMAIVRRRPARGVPWRSIQAMHPGEYPIFPSLRDVPNEVFENRSLVVEKFLPEITAGEYWLRFYYFFGSADFNVLLRCQSAYQGSIKTPTALREMGRAYKAEEVPVPEELYTMRTKLGFDYGKFDYALHDGKIVLFDANRTPGIGMLERWGLTKQVARRLAGGITSRLTMLRSNRGPADEVLVKEPEALQQHP